MQRIKIFNYLNAEKRGLIDTRTIVGIMRRGTYGIMLGIFFAMCFGVSNAQTIYFEEGFESGARPDNWTEDAVTGSIYWRYRQGGHNPSDPNLKENPADYNWLRNPNRAHTGTFNAWFFTQGFGKEQTKLITPAINLQNAITPVLKFWLTLYEWQNSTGTTHDILRVYYRKGTSGGWNLLQTYNFSQNTWREFQINLPDACINKDIYFAFEGYSRWGMGVCLDDIKIEETGESPKTLAESTSEEITNDFVPNGTNNNPVLCSRLRIKGNTGSSNLTSVKVNATATNLADITGVCVYATAEPVFTTANLIGRGALSGSSATITTTYEVPIGYSYLWVTYDISSTAKTGHIIDAEIPANGLTVSGNTYSSTAINSPYNRQIKQNLFFDDFETDKGWVLTPDFEIGKPLGKNGSFGNPDPTFAISGTKVLGNDLSDDGKYDANVESLHPYTATSPSFDALFYKGLKLNYQRWLNVDIFDTVRIQASPDGGTTWYNLWNNTEYVLDDGWNSHTVNFPTQFDRANNIKLRYTLSYSDDYKEFSGWNIDDVAVVGDYMENDLAVTEITSPTGTCGDDSGTMPIIIKVKNAGAKTATAPIPISFTYNTTVINENITVDIPAGAEKSITLTHEFPTNVYGTVKLLAKMLLPADEDAANDTLSKTIFVSRSFPVPYSNTFEDSNDWTAEGYEWRHGNSVVSEIQGENYDDKMWLTGLSGNYENNSTSTLTSPCFNITGMQKPMLEMLVNYQTEEGKDGVTLEYSVDNGTTWLLLGNNGNKWDNYWNWEKQSSIASAGGNKGFTGNSGGWITVSHLLPTALNNQTGVRFRLKFTSDGANRFFPGFGLNSFVIKEAPDDFSISAMTYPKELTGGSTCESFTNAEQITFTLKNAGIKIAKKDKPVNIKVTSKYYTSKTKFDNGEEPSRTENFEEELSLANDLGQNEEVSLTTTKTIDMNRGGLYNITITNIDDPDNFYETDNDTHTQNIEVHKPVVDLGPNTFLIDDGDAAHSAKAFDITSFTIGFDYNIKWEKKVGDAAWTADGTSGNERTVSISDFAYPTNKISYKITLTEKSAPYCEVSSVSDVFKLNPDIAVSTVVSPIDTCSLKNKQKITVRLINKGLDIDTIYAGTNISLSLNCLGADNTGSLTLTKDLEPGKTIDYTFPQEFDMSAIANYDIAAKATIPYDINDADQLSKTIVAFGYPNFAITPLDNLVSGISYEYDAGDYSKYLWHDSTTERTNTIDYPGPADGKVSCKVTDAHGCSTTSEGTISFKFDDLEVVGIEDIATACSQPARLYPRISIKNSGSETIAAATPVDFSISINGTTSTETVELPNDLVKGESGWVSLNSPIDITGKGTYHIEVTAAMPNDAISTNNTASIDFETYGVPEISLPDNVNANLGDVDVTLDAGAGFADYLWSTSETTQSIIVTAEGAYDVTVTDDNNCSSTHTTNVSFQRKDIAVSLKSQFSDDLTICNGSKEYEVVATITNTGNTTLEANEEIPISYRVGSVENDETAILTEPLAPGSSIDYTFAAKAKFETAKTVSLLAYSKMDDYSLDNNFSDIQQYVVKQTPVFVLPEDQQPTNSDYTIIPTITEPTAESTEYSGLVFSWNTGETTKNLTVSTSNEYILTITNDICSSSDTVKVLFNHIDLSIESVEVPINSCQSQEEESISFILKNTGLEDIAAGESVTFSYAIGGSTNTEPYTFTEPLAANATQNFTFSKKVLIGAGDNPLTVSLHYALDGISSNDLATIGITRTPYPAFALTDTIRSASASATLTGPSGSYTYLWSNNATSQETSVTESGTYQLTVTDADGCSFADTTVVIFKKEIELTQIGNINECINSDKPLRIEVKNTSGQKISSGEHLYISSIINGGDPTNEDYILKEDILPNSSAIITLSTKVPTGTIGNVNATVTIMLPGDADETNNTASKTIAVHDNPVFTMPADVTASTSPATLGGPDGFATYLWSTGATTQTIEITASGNYSLTVTDANGCSATQSTAVTFESDLAIESIDNTGGCIGGTAQPIAVTIKNASAVTINAGERITFMATINGSATGTETTTLDAAIAPGASKSITLNSITIPTATAGNAAIAVSFTRDGETNTENNSINKTIEIHALPAVNLPESSVASGNTFTISGPTGFTNYLWDSGESTPDLVVDDSGTYSLTVTDANGCSNTGSTKVIFMRSDVTLNRFVTPQRVCESATPIPLTIEVSNVGSSPILKGEVLVVASAIGGATFSENVTLQQDLEVGGLLEITTQHGIDGTAGKETAVSASVSYQYDANKENDNATATFTAVANPSFSLDITTVEDRTEATIKASKNDLQYEWSNGDKSQSITVYENATYSVVGTNADGCSTTKQTSISFLVASTNNFVLVFPEESETKCFDSKKSPFKVLLKNESLSTTITAGNLIDIFATYTITSTEGKQYVYTFKHQQVLGSDLTPQASISCQFEKMTFNGKETDNNIEQIAGTHKVEGYTMLNDKKSIIKTTQFAIWPIPNVNFGADTLYKTLPALLKLDLDQASNTFKWNTGETNSNIIVANEGDYSVTVTSSNGCSAEGKVYVKEGKNNEKAPSSNITKIDLYPNPAVTFANIEVTAEVMSAEVTVEIYTPHGVLVHSEIVICNIASTNAETGETLYKSEKISLSTDRFNSGSYIIVARGSNNKLSKTLIVTK